MHSLQKMDIHYLIKQLESVYGEPNLRKRMEPMDELISCILSQHTSDANSFPAFIRLKQTYPSWKEMVDAGEPAIEQVIKSAGLAKQKSKSIVKCLQVIYQKRGDYSIDFLLDLPVLEARKWLLELPGVGPKTASLVLCLSFGMDLIPVDTHVFRVAKRLGLLFENSTPEQAHDLLLQQVPAGLAFRFHVALIQHGRKICKAPRPYCWLCLLKDVCPWYAVHASSLKIPKTV